MVQSPSQMDGNVEEMRNVGVVQNIEGEGGECGGGRRLDICSSFGLPIRKRVIFKYNSKYSFG